MQTEVDQQPVFALVRAGFSNRAVQCTWGQAKAQIYSLCVVWMMLLQQLDEQGTLLCAVSGSGKHNPGRQSVGTRLQSE